MKALVYHGPGRIAYEERAKPRIEAETDAIVRIVKTTLCATDLRILKGDVSTCAPGRVLGHEGVGVIDEVGGRVTRFRPGDRVLISSVTACGECPSCRKQRYADCAVGGWILGNTIDGTQAELVRVPHSSTGLHPVPEGVDDDVLVMLSELLPTGLECGVVNGGVAPERSVAIVGSGTIGIAALLAAQLERPAALIVVDRDDFRLNLARQLGATAINSGHDGALDAILAAARGRGVDTAVDTVGIPATIALCEEIVRPGGTIVLAGPHGTPLAFRPEVASDKDVSVVSRPVDTASTAKLLDLLTSQRLDPRPLISHKLRFGEILHAYDLFGRSATTRALKIILEV